MESPRDVIETVRSHSHTSLSASPEPCGSHPLPHRTPAVDVKYLMKVEIKLGQSEGS